MSFGTRLGVQNSYSHRTKVGNWSEEAHALELAIKEHVSKSEIGSLKVHTLQSHLNASLSPAPLSFSPDGVLRFGDSVMFYSVQTEGVLSVDTQDSVPSSTDAFAVTTSTLTQAHVARNVFTIEPYDARDKRGDVLKYAQPFRIRINDALANQPCFMRSEPVSATSSSRLSRRQLVSFCTFPVKAQTPTAAPVATTATFAAPANGVMLKGGKLVPRVATPSASGSAAGSSAAGGGASGVAYPASPFDTVWKCVFKDIAKRFEHEGVPVPANAELLLEHAHTKHALSSDKLNYYNDFGVEFEVCAHTHLATNKKQNLYAELRGTTTVHTPVRHEHPQNVWAILTSSQPSDDADAAPHAADFKSTASFAATQQSQQSQPPPKSPAPQDFKSQKPPTPKVGQSGAAAPAAAASAAPKSPDAKQQAKAPLSPAHESDDGITALRKALMPRGPAAVHALSRFCRVLDSTRSGSIAAVDVSSALESLGGSELALSSAQWNSLCNAVATGYDTQLSYSKLLALLRGTLSGRRAAVVSAAFAKVDRLKRGFVKSADLASAYDASNDPQVKAKAKTPLQVVQLVVSAFDGYGGDNTVTAEEFADYYATVSAFVPNDDFFCKLIAQAYKVTL